MTESPHSQAQLHLIRETHFFMDHVSRMDELKADCQVLPMATDQLLHALVPRFYVVRKGKLRVSQFLDDGREVVRAVLQAGCILSTHSVQDVGDKPAADLYSLANVVIMALGETELWAFSRNPLENG